MRDNRLRLQQRVRAAQQEVDAWCLQIRNFDLSEQEAAYLYDQAKQAAQLAWPDTPLRVTAAEQEAREAARYHRCKRKRGESEQHLQEARSAWEEAGAALAAWPKAKAPVHRP